MKAVTCAWLALIATTAGATGWAMWARHAWLGAFELATSVAIAAVCLLGLTLTLRESVRGRIVLACVVLGAAPVVRVIELFGGELTAPAWDRGPVASVTALVCAAAAIGVWRRREWGRWLVCAGSIAGVGGSVLNGAATLADPGFDTWANAMALGISGSLGAALTGPRMRDAFAHGDAARNVWRSDDRIVRALRYTLVTNLAAVPMLLVYAWTQPVVARTAGPAVVLAVVLAIAAGLCAARLVVGALLLTAGGACLLVLTILTAMWSHDGRPIDPWIATYYAVFWTPASIVSLATGVALVQRLRARWRDG